MKIIVTYTYSSYSPCGDPSCCSDSDSYIEFQNENGKYWERDNVELIEDEEELLNYVKRRYPNDEIVVDVENCQFY